MPVPAPRTTRRTTRSSAAISSAPPIQPPKPTSTARRKTASSPSSSPAARTSKSVEATVPTNLPIKVLVMDLDLTVICTIGKADLGYDMQLSTDPDLLEPRERFYRITIPIDRNMCRISDGDPSQPEHLQVFLYDGVETQIGFIRPHAAHFLHECRKLFDYIVVQTAAVYAYGIAIVEFLFQDTQPPDVLFTRDDCVMYKSRNEDGKMGRRFEKPLDLIAQMFGVHVDQVLLIDDSEYSSPRFPVNTILIHEYSGEMFEDREDRHMSDDERMEAQRLSEKPKLPENMAHKPPAEIQVFKKWLCAPDPTLLILLEILQTHASKGVDAVQRECVRRGVSHSFPYPLSMYPEKFHEQMERERPRYLRAVSLK